MSWVDALQAYSMMNDDPNIIILFISI